MDWYTFVSIAEFLVVLAALGLVGYLAYNYIQENRPAWEETKRHSNTKARLNAVRVPDKNLPLTLDPEDEITPLEAHKRNNELMGMVSVNAGNHILKVPELDPGQSGAWNADRTVLSVARAIAYTRQGTDPVDITELNEGYSIVACGGKVLLMTNYHLTTVEETYLEKERQRAVDSSDMVIENFQGHKWDISGAFGTNVTRKAGERECSYIQVLDIHPEIGKAGLRSVLPPKILDGQMHDYYDMRARRKDGEQIMFFFYTAGKWNCYLGRFLTKEEIDGMQGV